jgi:hypothetical protein
MRRLLEADENAGLVWAPACGRPCCTREPPAEGMCAAPDPAVTTVPMVCGRPCCRSVSTTASANVVHIRDHPELILISTQKRQRHRIEELNNTNIRLSRGGRQQLAAAADGMCTQKGEPPADGMCTQKRQRHRIEELNNAKRRLSRGGRQQLAASVP